MPSPPRESIGGFMLNALESQKQRLDSDLVLLHRFADSDEFKTYDADFRSYVKQRVSLVESIKSQIENIDMSPKA